MREVTYLVDTLPPPHFMVGYTLLMAPALEINCREQEWCINGRCDKDIFSFQRGYGGRGNIPIIIICQPAKLLLS